MKIKERFISIANILKEKDIIGLYAASNNSEISEVILF